MDLLQRLNKIAAEFGLNGANDARLAIAACALLDQNNEISLDGRDLPGTMARMVTALSATQKAAIAGALLPYKVWIGLLSQSGSAAPTASVYANTLGGNIVWSRTSAGLYAGTLVGAFPAGKIFPVSGFTDYAALTVFTVARASNDVVSVATPDGDGVLNNTPVEIRVYNNPG